MLHLQIQTCWGVFLCFLITSIHFSHCGPSYPDYENIRDLYELLLQKEMVQDVPNPNHQMIRKSPRSPSLRLRFGKKSDPYMMGQSFVGHPLRINEDSIDN